MNNQAANLTNSSSLFGNLSLIGMQMNQKDSLDMTVAINDAKRETQKIAE